MFLIALALSFGFSYLVRSSLILHSTACMEYGGGVELRLLYTHLHRRRKEGLLYKSGSRNVLAWLEPGRSFEYGVAGWHGVVGLWYALIITLARSFGREEGHGWMIMMVWL